MQRRNLLRLGLFLTSSIGVTTQYSTNVRAESSITSEIDLPTDDAVGLGVASTDDETVFVVGFDYNAYYYIYPDGSSEGPNNFDNFQDFALPGIGMTTENLYWGTGIGLNRADFDRENISDRRMPDRIASIATDKNSETVWVGGEDGDVWKVNSSSLDIEQTFQDFTDYIYGLAHDGEYLWVGDSDVNHIQQYDPEEETTAVTHEFPDDVTVSDFAYIDDRLWMIGEDTLYETDITQSTPNENPSASFSISTDTPSVGEEVSFDASLSEDPDGEIVTYQWDFTGDDAVDANGETVSHRFDEVGEYTTSLAVTDGRGATDITSQELTVVEPPEARMSLSPSDPETEEEVTFIGSSSNPDMQVETYRWDLTGDDTIDATGQEVTHTYENPGRFEVTLSIEYNIGSNSETQNIITVSEGASAEDSEVEESDTESSPDVDEIIEPPEEEIEESETESSNEDINPEEGQQEPENTENRGEEPESNDPTEESLDSDDEGSVSSSTPGFGIGSAIASLGGAGYLLKRRLYNTESDSE